MKRLALTALAVLLAASTLHAAEEARCSLCVGSVADPALAPSTGVPLLVRATAARMADATATVASLSAGQRRRTTVIVRSEPVAASDQRLDVERRVAEIVEWGRVHGPFEAIGLDVDAADELAAYALRRLSVTAQGQGVSTRIMFGPATTSELEMLLSNGAEGYFDVVLVPGEEVKRISEWLAERDPSKRVAAVVEPRSPNPLFDAARALADGATTAYLTGSVPPDAISAFNRAMTGDYAYDSTAATTILDAKGSPADAGVVTFVRGEDLRSVVVPQGLAGAASIVALPGDRYAKPRRLDQNGEREIRDTGTRGGRLLVGVQPGTSPFAIVVDQAEAIQPNVTREAIDVATERGISVEEIIRNHQAYDVFQESIQPRYIAQNTTSLRFAVGDSGEAVEASISGEYFSEPGGRADWVWQDFYVNGVRWKYGRIPELPLIQPEKVTQLPLDLHLTNEYRYELVRQTDMLGHRVYEVRFEPPRNAPETLPLYRGTVWIDARTWARIRISMVQLNLKGEVLSNEERVDFHPFSRDGGRPLTIEEASRLDARDLFWLPRDVWAQQVISAAGRASVVQRSTEFSDFRIDPTDFSARLEAVSTSDARMVRETPAGLRYLERREGGERVVKEGYDTAQTFMVGGIHHDSGLEFPVVPLGGINYFNFNLRGTGIQTNVFFAGLVLAANATHPNVGNTRTNIGADFFGIAIPTENSMYREGSEREEEAVKSLPLGLTLRAGRPFFTFAKVDLSLGLSHSTYQRAETTAAGFEVPSDTFVVSPAISATYSRRGWTASAFYDWATRTSWEPWGNLDEYDEKQKSFARFGAGLGKVFYLPKYQRIGVDVNYLDGSRLDRFSKYELGFFGSRRIHGIKSGSVRAERAILSHLSYGFVFSEQFRMEAFYDHGLLDDELAGFSLEPFQGVGIAGQTVGPWGTLVRLDIGKSIGRNAQEGFVANVVFLKLF